MKDYQFDNEHLKNTLPPKPIPKPIGLSLDALSFEPIVRATIQTINSMVEYEFCQLYGEKTGKHLWSKYEACNKDAGELVCKMDQVNLARMIQNALSDDPIIERL
jgi:hypothetical protein